MCLTVKKLSRVQIAKKDIVVYKVLNLEVMHGRTVYVSGYYGFLYTIGELNQLESELVKTSPNQFNDNFLVEEGFHSFTLLKDAKAEISYWGEGVVFKAIIPKGSKYFVGTFHNIESTDVKSYASDQIIIEKILN